MSKNAEAVFPYIPNSVPEIKAQMLREVGAHDEMDLYAEIPERLRFKGKLNQSAMLKPCSRRIRTVRIF